MSSDRTLQPIGKKLTLLFKYSPVFDFKKKKKNSRLRWLRNMLKRIKSCNTHDLAKIIHLFSIFLNRIVSTENSKFSKNCNTYIFAVKKKKEKVESSSETSQRIYTSFILSALQLMDRISQKNFSSIQHYSSLCMIYVREKIFIQ